MIKPRPYQTEALNAVLENWQNGVNRQLVSLPTGCHAAGTKILMFDGSLKNVEDVAIDDLLMGPDSTPRTVLSLVYGEDDMFRINPVKGEPFTVNGKHILSLKRTPIKNPSNGRAAPSQTGGQIINISVVDYLQRTNNFKHIHKLYRVPVEFGEKAVTIDPYFLGVLLGDGSTTNNAISVTKPDEAIINECYAQARHWGLKIRKTQREGTQIVTCFFITQEGKRSPKNSNRLRNELAMLGLNGLKAGEKFVPENYKVNTRAVRLNVLAGLLDTDGSLRDGGFEFSSKSRRLADDAAFLSRSLGLAAYISVKRVKNCDYYRVMISGDCSMIPTRIPRKQAAKRQQKKDVLVTGFSVEPEGRGRYYGFGVDGDNLYVMGDFTVTHNCGKTIIFGMIANALKTKTLILAHREELLTQAQQKIKLVYPEAETGILQAERRDGLDAQICIASVQTAVRRTEELAQKGYKLLICDEAHHAPSSSYIKVFGELGFLHGEAQGMLLIGVTATAFRKDGVGLGNVFDKIVFERSIAAMVKAGYLCPPRALEVKTGADISDVNITAGDLNIGKLDKKINTPKRNELVANTYVEYGENRHGVVFCATVDHALNVAEAFKDKGITCETVYGDMPSDDRRDILAKYEKHEIQILTNCGVLTEGWDVPDTDIIMMARPTGSRGLYTQCVGRGLRTAPKSGKKDCLIIDFVDVSKKYDLCKFGELIGKELQPAKSKSKPQWFGDGDTDEGMYNEAVGTPQVRQLELLAQSAFVWTPQGNNYTLSLVDGSVLVCQHDGNGDEFRPVYISPDGMSNLSGEVLPIGYAMGTCEDFARKLSIGNLSLKNAAWRTRPATEKQINILKKAGIAFKPDLTRGEAMSMIETRSNIPATDKQKWFITRHRLHPTPDLLTIKQASQIIGKFKQQQAS